MWTLPFLYASNFEENERLHNNMFFLFEEPKNRHRYETDDDEYAVSCIEVEDNKYKKPCTAYEL